MTSSLSFSGKIPTKKSELYVEQEGNSSGPAILFIHGLGGTTNTFQPLVSSLQDYNIVRFEWSGHGRSTRPERTSIESYVEDCEAIIDHFQLKDITVVAHSLGGLIALHLSARIPSLVSRLILFGPVKSPPQVGRDGCKARAESVRKGGMAAVVDAVIAGALPLQLLRNRPEVVGYARELLSRQDPEGYALACLALGTSEDPLWSKIEAEVIVVSGEEDKVSSPHTCKEIVRDLHQSKAKLISWKGTGHWHTLEAPLDCRKLILESLTTSK